MGPWPQASPLGLIFSRFVAHGAIPVRRVLLSVVSGARNTPRFSRSYVGDVVGGCDSGR